MLHQSFINPCWVILCWSQFNNYDPQLYLVEKCIITIILNMWTFFIYFIYNVLKPTSWFRSYLVYLKQIYLKLDFNRYFHSGQSWPRSNGNERVTSHSLELQNWSLTTRYNFGQTQDIWNNKNGRSTSFTANLEIIVQFFIFCLFTKLSLAHG